MFEADDVVRAVGNAGVTTPPRDEPPILELDAYCRVFPEHRRKDDRFEQASHHNRIVPIANLDLEAIIDLRRLGAERAPVVESRRDPMVVGADAEPEIPGLGNPRDGDGERFAILVGPTVRPCRPAMGEQAIWIAADRSEQHGSEASRSAQERGRGGVSMSLQVEEAVCAPPPRHRPLAAQCAGAALHLDRRTNHEQESDDQPERRHWLPPGDNAPDEGKQDETASGSERSAADPTGLRENVASATVGGGLHAESLRRAG